MSVTIREAREADLPRLTELESACFSDPWPDSAFRCSMTEGRRLLTAWEGEALLGYAALWTVLDEGEIANVAVAPEARRRGIGDALLSAAVALAREAGLACLQLEVRAGNAPALALYEKRGFQAVGRRKNYYEKPREDAILMTLVLSHD